MRAKKQRLSQAEISACEAQIKSCTKSIDYTTAEYTLELLVQKLEKETLFIPSYQRKNIWDKNRKSKFIESLLIGLPIPFLFFWQDPKSGKIEVVDGAQRLTTLKEFFHSELILQNLEKITCANGLVFDDLLEARKEKLRNKTIRSIILTEKTDKEARLDLFERINTGSVAALPAEIRRGLLQGAFYDLVLELCEHELFNKLAVISQQSKNKGEAEELIVRFFAFSDGIDSYKNSMKNFIFDYTEQMNKKFNEDKELNNEYRDRFNLILNFYNNVYPKGFRREKNKLSRTRFEAMTVGAYLAKKEVPNILQNITSENCIELFEKSENFERITRSDGANTKSKVIARLNVVKDYFLNLATNS